MAEDWYNLTNFTSQDELVGIFQVANEYTNGLFGTLILLGFFVMLLIITYRSQTKHALTVSAWVTSVIGMLYMPLGILNGWVVVLVIVIFTIGFMGLFYD